MSTPQPEPSMEEILASIRRIISEDGDDQGAERTAAEPVPAARAASPPQAKRAEPRPPEPRAETDVTKEGLEMMKKNVTEAVQDNDEAMLDEMTAEAASNAFQVLSQSVRVSSGGGRTLEEIVIDMLRPMIKDWLDANLAGLVEEKVEEEVQRLARRRR